MALGWLNNMPNKELASRIEAVEKRVDEHIHDGIGVWQAIEGVKTDLAWIKRGLWSLIALVTVLAPLTVKFMLSVLSR